MDEATQRSPSPTGSSTTSDSSVIAEMEKTITSSPVASTSDSSAIAEMEKTITSSPVASTSNSCVIAKKDETISSSSSASPWPSDSFEVVKTWIFEDGFKIEQVTHTPSKPEIAQNEEEEEIECEADGDNANDTLTSSEPDTAGDEEITNAEQDQAVDAEDGDDASTIILDDTETAEDRLNALIEENIESLHPQGDESIEQKLEPIFEEIPVNEEPEEEYEGAAGLWAQDFQLPCFKAQENGFPPPRVQRMEYQRSSVNDWVQPTLAANWQQDKSPFHVAPISVQHLLQSVNQGAMPKVCATAKVCATLDDIIKLTNDNLVFTKEQSDCAICKRPLDIGRGVVLKDCLHTFCRRCLVHAINNNKNSVMMCPSQLVKCQGEVRDEEIKALLNPEAYEKYNIEMLVRMDMIDMSQLHGDYEFVENKNAFQCDICMKDIVPGDGIVLKECLHQYCKPCLGRYIQTSEDVDVPCPFRAEDGSKCVGNIMDSEMRSLVPLDVYRGFLDKSIAQAEAANPNAYHCKTPDCPFWLEIDCDVEQFTCGACKRTNCVKCKAVHQGVTCQNYQEMMHGPDRRARENVATENQVRNLIARKDAQPCPRCGIITQRISGCRHMTCTKCKHEFQWTGNDLN